MPRDTNFLASDVDVAADASSARPSRSLAQRLLSIAIFLFCYSYYAATVLLIGYGVKLVLVAVR